MAFGESECYTMSNCATITGIMLREQLSREIRFPGAIIQIDFIEHLCLLRPVVITFWY